jgi:hypothetical protein
MFQGAFPKSKPYRRAQAVLAIAALGAAGMFLGGEGWLGINLGSVGAAVLYAALWLMPIFGWMVMGSILRKQDSGGVQFDQRDLRIAHRASRVADGALALLVVWLVVALMALPDQSRTWLRPLIAANVLVGVLVVRALVESICTLWSYRREHA